MKYVTLNHSDLNVSRICLGCMSFGVPSSGQYQWTLEYMAELCKVMQDKYCREVVHKEENEE